MRLALLLLLALGLGGCKSKCRQLAEKLCECALNTNEKNACVGRAATAEGSNPGTPDQETYCMSLLQPGGCDCRLIDTPEGKVHCGLARDPKNISGTADAGS